MGFFSRSYFHNSYFKRIKRKWNSTVSWSVMSQIFSPHPSSYKTVGNVDYGDQMLHWCERCCKASRWLVLINWDALVFPVLVGDSLHNAFYLAFNRFLLNNSWSLYLQPLAFLFPKSFLNILFSILKDKFEEISIL